MTQDVAREPIVLWHGEEAGVGGWTTAAAPGTSGIVGVEGLASTPTASSTSAAQVTGVAPWRRSAFAPALRALVISPGTASTSRPSSSAKSAVMRAPERSRASTTTVARASPAMIRFLAGWCRTARYRRRT